MDVTTSRELQILQDLIFLIMYLGALAGNFLTLIVIINDPQLYSPMYFFLGNYPSYIFAAFQLLFKLIVNSLSNYKLISLPACATQIFLYILFESTEFLFPMVMSYDCFVARCHTLHYGLTITPRLCTQTAGGAWACGLVYSAINIGYMFRLPFTESNVIHQYLCDVPQILRISSSDVHFSDSMVLVLSACVVLVSSAFMFKSYIYIFSMILRMHSVEAHNKALSIYTPQMAIVILFVVSGLTADFGSSANDPSLSNLLMAMFYIMVPPFINPIFYSLWKREIKIALPRMFYKNFQMHGGIFLLKNSVK